MEKLPSQQFAEQQAYFARQESWFHELAVNIASPGWIESQMEKNPTLAVWTQGLKLADLTPVERFSRLAQVIIPLQQTLVGQVLPTVDERVRQLEIQKTDRIRTLRDNFDLSPLYPPLRDYSGIVSSQEISKFLKNTASPERRDVLRGFLTEKGASRIFNAIVNYTGIDVPGEHSFDSYLAGAILEEIGYLSASRQNRNRHTTVLSPEETDIIFKNIYPDRFGPVDPYGFNYGVEGMSIPDGLVISDSKEFLDIVLVVEYKSISRDHPDISKIKAQKEYYTSEQLESDLRLKNHKPIDPDDMGRLFHAVRPSLPTKPVRVIPNLHPLYIIPAHTDLNITGVLAEEAPITTGMLYVFSQALKQVQILRRK